MLRTEIEDARLSFRRNRNFLFINKLAQVATVAKQFPYDFNKKGKKQFVFSRRKREYEMKAVVNYMK